MLMYYLAVYPSWCSYYGSMKPNLNVLPWLKFLEEHERLDLDLTDAPGFALKSDDSYDIGPLIMSLVYDSHFKGLIVHDIPRRDTFYEATLPLSNFNAVFSVFFQAAEVVRNNKVLKKLVLVNVDGDAGGFQALGAALNGNTNDNIQVCSGSLH